jgi:hypothetical protein
MYANLAHSANAPMDYHARTTYATNQMIPVKTPLLIAFHQMIHAQQINASNLLVGVNSFVVPHWKHGRASAALALPI